MTSTNAEETSVAHAATPQSRRQALQRFGRYAAAAPSAMILLQPSEGHAAKRPKPPKRPRAANGQGRRWPLLTLGTGMLRCDYPVDAGTKSSSHRVELDGIALPLNDHLIVIASDGGVLALDAGGRRLWEALQAGCTADDLVEAGVEHGGLPREMARANVADALEEWRALGLIDGAA